MVATILIDLFYFLITLFCNIALLLYRLGDFQDAYTNVSKSLEVYPNHDDSKELKETLQKLFATS